MKIDASGLYTGKHNTRGARMVAIAEHVDTVKGGPKEKFAAWLDHANADLTAAIATGDLEDVADVVETAHRNKDAIAIMLFGGHAA